MNVVAAPAALDNVFWQAMTGPQAPITVGSARARRYAPGFSQLMGFEDPSVPDLDGIAPFCRAGERIYCNEWEGAPPAGWVVHVQKRMTRMVFAGRVADEDTAPDSVPLDASHAEQALALAVLTNPGPFGLRTIEMGEFHGLFEGGRLVAMAGERIHAGRHREVSGICTHPDFQGRGLARRLTAKILRLQVARGQVPFLHLMSDNATALALYRRMGFREDAETTVRIIEHVGAA